MCKQKNRLIYTTVLAAKNSAVTCLVERRPLGQPLRGCAGLTPAATKPVAPVECGPLVLPCLSAGLPAGAGESNLKGQQATGKAKREQALALQKYAEAA